jgi:hypothetical protein
MLITQEIESNSRQEVEKTHIRKEKPLHPRHLFEYTKRLDKFCYEIHAVLSMH